MIVRLDDALFKKDKCQLEVQDYPLLQQPGSDAHKLPRKSKIIGRLYSVWTHVLSQIYLADGKVDVIGIIVVYMEPYYAFIPFVLPWVMARMELDTPFLELRNTLQNLSFPEQVTLYVLRIGVLMLTAVARCLSTVFLILLLGIRAIVTSHVSIFATCGRACVQGIAASKRNIWKGSRIFGHIICILPRVSVSQAVGFVTKCICYVFRSALAFVLFFYFPRNRHRICNIFFVVFCHVGGRNKLNPNVDLDTFLCSIGNRGRQTQASSNFLKILNSQKKCVCLKSLIIQCNARDIPTNFLIPLKLGSKIKLDKDHCMPHFKQKSGSDNILSVNAKNKRYSNA